MNARVHELIQKKVVEQSIEKERLKKAHLRRLGLTEGGSERVYSKNIIYTDPTCKYDEELGMYYVDKPKVVELTDEEYDELCKYYPQSGGISSTKVNKATKTIDSISEKYGAENTLKIVATVFLIVGIILSIVGISILSDSWYPKLIVLVIAIFFMILSTWALMHCIANISTTLKDIDEKISKQK